ncbi:MAG: curli-like amyloid fiber formation chaperone CsgH [Pseudomonadota bacterium]
MMDWMSLLVAPALAGTVVPPSERAVSLEISERGDKIVVELNANSPHRQHVSFTVELTGNSTSKHSGSITLAANDHQTLSTLKMGNAGKWCARVVVEEEGSAPYELREGICET